MQPFRSRTPSTLLAVVLAALLVTCRDDPAGPGRSGYVVVRPVYVSTVDLAAFGVVADTLRVAVVRPPADTLRALTLFFDPDSSQIRTDLRVVLRTAVETLAVHLELRGGGFALFSGTRAVEVRAGRAATVQDVPLTYTGPGSDIAVVTIAPRDTVLTFGDSLRFRVSALDSAGAPVPFFYSAWSTPDTSVLRVNAAGLVRAPGGRTVSYVRVRAPAGAADSTPATIVPLPTALARVSGTGQNGVAGTLLAQPLRVRVTAGDGLGVKGIPVRFRPVAGGAVADSVVVSDTGGYAQTAVTLGPVAGPAGFEARAPALPAVSFTATALAAAVSTTTSTITTSAATVLSGSGATLTLAAKDPFGNRLTTGGASVRFLASGGTSTGTVSGTVDNGDGTYGATFVGVLAGTPTDIGATIGGSPVTSPLPAIAVTPGPISTATSLVTASDTSVPSGAAATLTLQAKDAAGNSLSLGGATVAFVAAGGTSTGTIGPVTDHANGTYSASFTGMFAGTALTIGASLNGSPVATLAPTLSVTPGVVSAATSLIAVSSGNVTTGALATLTLRARDAAGNSLTSGGALVVFLESGGPSVGTISATTDQGDGTYTATFTGAAVGTATIGAEVDGTPVTSTLPVITVAPSGTVEASSSVAASVPSLVSGAVATLTLTARDGAGVPQLGRVVVFSHAGGTSTGLIGATTENANGIYTATFTGVLAGSATTIGATLDGTPVTSTLPTIAVLPGPIAAGTSLVTTSAATVLSGTPATLTLRGRDAAGNALTSGGSTVGFTTSGGTSTGTIGPVTDHGDGTYTATFTGLLAGTATSIGATIDTSVVTSALPAVTVRPGAVSPATSVVTTSRGSVLAGTGATLTLLARDAAGNDLTGGGSTIAFTTAGGTSAGSISPFPATDHGNGTYSATFTGITAGTATAVGATIDGKPVTSAVPTITVTPAAATRLSFVTQPAGALAADTLAPVQVAAQDPYGNTDPSFAGVVSLRIEAAPDPAAALHGVTDAPAATGSATFADVNVDSAGPGYTLLATSGALAPAVSAPFTVGGVIAAPPVGQAPIAVGVNSQTNRVYVANNGSGSVTVIDGGKLSVVATLTGIELPFGVGVNETTNKIYVSGAGAGTLLVIDGATNVTLPIPSVGSNPQGVAVDPQANRIYTAAVGLIPPVPSLVPIDGSKDLVIVTEIVTLPAAGLGVAFNPTDGFVYVVLPSQDAVAVVDPLGARVVSTIPVGPGPYGIAVNPSANLVYVTNATDGSVSVIDPATAREAGRVAVGKTPQGLGVDTRTGLVYVANSGDGTVSVIDGAKRVVVATLPVGATPHDAAVSAATGRVFVPVAGQAALKVVQP